MQSLGNLKRKVKVLLVKVSISFCLLPNAIAIGCNSNKLICQPFRTEFAFKHSPSFKLDWPFRCLVISCMFTSHVSHLRKPIKYYSADLVRKGGWGGYPSCPQLVFLEQVKKTSCFVLFGDFFPLSSLWMLQKKGRDPLFTYVFMIYFDISIFDIFLHADSQILVCPFHSHFVAAAPFRQRGSSSSVGKRKRNLNLTYQGHIRHVIISIYS